MHNVLLSQHFTHAFDAGGFVAFVFLCYCRRCIWDQVRSQSSVITWQMYHHQPELSVRTQLTFQLQDGVMRSAVPSPDRVSSTVVYNPCRTLHSLDTVASMVAPKPARPLTKARIRKPEIWIFPVFLRFILMERNKNCCRRSNYTVDILYVSL